MAVTIEDVVRQQVACELEKSTLLEDPGGWPNYDEITKAINNMDNAEFLRVISGVLETCLLPPCQP
jgi:hypothetical protein